ncbi:hypothetical protein DM015_14650 [Salmonella enterica subsp. enterica serovar Livingstone]|nr:hypothetical protein [Salmonella enterica subsp. enterica serovar Livingstone]EAA7804960.1 hypothetical protein [Salmonella enterica subsp. enterica serovar Heidelberg]EBC1701014.1 hypothetical protein [Salmonella enterica subsp. enterica]MIP16018.1 hypothetical protein [Salmonella enterica]EAC0853432.1 hypothetical protein [Salmonella enterica subsp. enterica serovar Livingstone]
MPGKNVIYWNEIIRASERSGIIPQSIALLFMLKRLNIVVATGNRLQYVRILKNRQKKIRYIKVQRRV